MFATLLLSGVIKGSARAFAFVTRVLANNKDARWVKSEEINIVEATLYVTDAELHELQNVRAWEMGQLRSQEYKRTRAKAYERAGVER